MCYKSLTNLHLNGERGAFKTLMEKWHFNYVREVTQTIEQRWRSGESARLPPLWPRFNSRIWHHMWVEFVVGSRPCSEGFSPGSLVFLPPQKLTLQIPIQSGNEGHRFVSFAVSVTLTK